MDELRSQLYSLIDEIILKKYENTNNQRIIDNEQRYLKDHLKHKLKKDLFVNKLLETYSVDEVAISYLFNYFENIHYRKDLSKIINSSKDLNENHKKVFSLLRDFSKKEYFCEECNECDYYETLDFNFFENIDGNYNCGIKNEIVLPHKNIVLEPRRAFTHEEKQKRNQHAILNKNGTYLSGKKNIKKVIKSSNTWLNDFNNKTSKKIISYLEILCSNLKINYKSNYSIINESLKISEKIIKTLGTSDLTHTASISLLLYLKHNETPYEIKHVFKAMDAKKEEKKRIRNSYGEIKKAITNKDIIFNFKKSKNQNRDFKIYFYCSELELSEKEPIEIINYFNKIKLDEWIGGRPVRSMIGAAIYIKNINEFNQTKVANKCNITEVTLRSSKKILDKINLDLINKKELTNYKKNLNINKKIIIDSNKIFNSFLTTKDGINFFTGKKEAYNKDLIKKATIYSLYKAYKIHNIEFNPYFFL